MEILSSARKHGISDDDIRHAVDNALVGSTVDERTEFMMLVGPDESGNLLEIGLVVADDIDYVVHAMRARQQYLDWL